jgi:hypothetical protein
VISIQDAESELQPYLMRTAISLFASAYGNCGSYPVRKGGSRWDTAALGCRHASVESKAEISG